MNIGIIAEGPSDILIMDYILQRYLGEVVVNPIEPKIDNKNRQVGYGGWANVLKVCHAEKLSEALSYNDLIIIQIDTDVCEEIGFDVKKTNTDNTPKPHADLYVEIKEKLLEQLTEGEREFYSDKLIFAICFEEIECWLLPIYYTNNDKCKTVGCLSKLNTALKKKHGDIIPEDKKNTPESQRKYKAILKDGFKKKKDIKSCSAHNHGFERFIEQLDTLSET